VKLIGEKRFMFFKMAMNVDVRIMVMGGEGG